MHCLFHPKLKKGVQDYFFDIDELKHLKALRLRVGEKVMITNGRGLTLLGYISYFQKNQLIIRDAEFFENTGELDFKISIGLSILENRERMEFALEKCIELGAKEFIPLITENCQKSTINHERLQTKSLAALKQCQRSELIKIYSPTDILSLEKKINDFDSIFLADINGETYNKNYRKGTNLILVGPEGGFSKAEVNFIKKNPKTIPINLGNRRLRAETAAIAMMTLLSLEC